MSITIRFAFAAPPLLWSISVFAVISADPDTPESLQKAFPEVVRIQSGKEVCTGTIIGPRVILSAAHCADLKNPFFIHQGKRYDLVLSPSGEYKAREHDVAVGVTSRNIRGARFAAIGSGLKHGSKLYLAGFGCTRRGGKSGPLHMGSTRVIGMDTDHVLSFSRTGGVLCQGDSGGPAFLREGGRHYVVAVNSAGDNRNINLNVRLDSPLSRGFLKRVAEKFKVTICGIRGRCQGAGGPAQVARLDE